MMGEAAGNSAEESKRLVLVVQHDSSDSIHGSVLSNALREIRVCRWWIISGTTIATLMAALYAFLAPPVFRAEVVLYPREARAAGGLSGQLAQLGGLADMAGISVGGGSKQEPLGVLRSNGFAARFITSRDLARYLVPESPTDVRRATEYFSRNVLGVHEDKRTGLIIVGVRWGDPDVAATWANAVVAKLNEEMRARALQESEANVRYLRSQVGGSTVVPLQESVSRLLEAELQKEMLARGAAEYSFRIVDRAEPPLRPISPNRSLIVAMAFFLGLTLSSFAAVVARPVLGAWAGSRVP